MLRKSVLKYFGLLPLPSAKTLSCLPPTAAAQNSKKGAKIQTLSYFRETLADPCLSPDLPTNKLVLCLSVQLLDVKVELLLVSLKLQSTVIGSQVCLESDSNKHFSANFDSLSKPHKVGQKLDVLGTNGYKMMRSYG